jgi:hypothetical protein
MEQGRVSDNNKPDVKGIQTPTSRGGGPCTGKGKERSKFNGVTHGIFSAIVLRGQKASESACDYELVLASLRKALQPYDSLEELLTEALAFEFLRLARIYQVDSRVAPQMFEWVAKGLAREGPYVITQEVDKKTETVLVRKELDPELILRYGTSVSKQIHRILDRLGSLKKMRSGDE